MCTPETCVQYLVLDDSVFARPDGHCSACCPQVKKPKDVARLWAGVNDGEVCVISTDHLHVLAGAEGRGEGDWTKIPMGLPGLKRSLRWSTPAACSRPDAADPLVEKCCANPAKIMGLYPRKGVLAAGSDADIVVIDPKKTFTVDHATMRRGRLEPHQGMELAGFAEHTFVRGRQVVAITSASARWAGQWLPRERAGSL